jgi:hypothetical protein
MIGGGDPDDVGSLGYATREGPTPKLVIVGIVWAGFGVFGLFTAMLMHSSGFAIFGALCIVAGIALYFGQRTRDQLAYDEVHLSNDPWSPPSDDPADREDEGPAADENTRVHSAHDQDDDILDAEYTEYFEYDQSPADQDDGTGYDEEEMAYQRYQAAQQAREADSDLDEDEDEDPDEDRAGEDDEHDDVARTSRIPTGTADDGHGASAEDGDHTDHGDHDASGGSGSAGSDHEDHEGSAGRRR